MRLMDQSDLYIPGTRIGESVSVRYDIMIWPGEGRPMGRTASSTDTVATPSYVLQSA